MGRAAIIKTLLDQLPKRRFITLVGPGGIGKTTVALAVVEAAARAGEVCFVDLGPLSDPTLVPGKLMSALGVADQRGDQLEDIARFLRDRAMLIAFDTCEHVLETVTPLIQAILNGAPNVRILTTSREPLRGKGEWIQRLAPLAAPAGDAATTAAEVLAYPAVQLFVDRAASSLGGLDLTDADAAIVANLCRKLDGLPLAIELVAGRIGAFGLKGLSDLLDRRLTLPGLGTRIAPARHRTLTATLDWSYETLAERERAMLRRLAVFVGAFTLEAAICVAGDGGLLDSDAVDCLANLVECSLVAADIGETDAHYRLLDTTRAYAFEKLSEQNELEPLARRHAEYYRSLFERTGAVRETRPADRLAAYRHEIDNVRSALDWAFSSSGDAALGVALTLAAIPLWKHLSLNEECRLRVNTALAALDPNAAAEDRIRMQLFAALAGAQFLTSAFLPEMSVAWSSALQIAKKLSDTDFQLRALWGLWIENNQVGKFREALATSREFTRVAASSSQADVLIGERITGVSLYLLGEHEEAQRLLEHMLVHYAPDPAHITRFHLDQRVLARGWLPIVLWLRGFPDQALRMIQANIADAEGGHAISFTSAIGLSACPITLYAGDLASAAHFIKILGDRNADRAWTQWEKSARCYEAILLIKQGDLASGTNRLAAAIEALPDNAFHLRFIPFLCELAEGLWRRGQIDMASARIEQALGLSRRNEELWYMPELLRVKGEIARSAGAPEQAENSFRDALEWAQKQTALAWELRAATSLAQLRRDQGRLREGYDALESVYRRFTEGFETGDLKAAKGLLDALK